MLLREFITTRKLVKEQLSVHLSLKLGHIKLYALLNMRIIKSLISYTGMYIMLCHGFFLHADDCHKYDLVEHFEHDFVM